MSAVREGHYNFQHATGAFPVQIRRYGSFYCQQYCTTSSWAILDTGKLFIDFGKYGKFEFTNTDNSYNEYDGM